MKGDNEPRRFTVRRLMVILLVLVMAVSGVEFVRDHLESRQRRREQESLALIMSGTTEAVEEETVTEEVLTEAETPQAPPIDFDVLLAQNPDTVGWIRIPDTRIDYPIVQAEDNETYLHTAFDGSENIHGTIYLDCDSDPDFYGWNHPLYGHHMRDGSMFKDVIKFKDKDYFKAHQYFEIYTPARTIHLKAVSCYYTDSNGIVRMTEFSSQEAFDQWTKERLEPCSFAEIPEHSVDSMFVLVTCSYETNDARTLLFAVEVDEDGEVVASGGRNE